MAQSRARCLQRRRFLFCPPVSARLHSQHSPCSRRFSAPRFQSQQTPPPQPLRACRRPWHRNERQSLLASFILRHHFFAANKYLAHHSFLRHGKNLEPVCAPLLQLLHLDFSHHRQVPLGPDVLDKLERIIFS